MENEVIRTWKYKDAWRCWWEITLWKSGEQRIVDSLGAYSEVSDDVDFLWEYNIGYEGKEPFHMATIVGQYDLVPHLHDVLLDFSNYIQSVCLGFAEYSKAEEESDRN